MSAKFAISLCAVMFVLLGLGCTAKTAHALPVALAEETKEVVHDIQSTEQEVFLTLQTNLEKVRGMSKGLQEDPENPAHRDEIVTVLQEVTQSFQGLSNRKRDFRQELQRKLEHLEELQGRADEAIQELETRKVELAKERDSSVSNDPIVVAARYQAFQQAQGYVDDQIHIWNQFVDTHVAIQTELGTINQRIEGFLSMVDATAVVYREALNLVSLQQDVRWALSLFTDDVPQMSVLTEDMETSWGTIDSLVTSLLTLTEPASADPV